MFYKCLQFSFYLSNVFFSYWIFIFHMYKHFILYIMILQLVTNQLVALTDCKTGCRNHATQTDLAEEGTGKQMQIVIWCKHTYIFKICSHMHTIPQKLFISPAGKLLFGSFWLGMQKRFSDIFFPPTNSMCLFLPRCKCVLLFEYRREYVCVYLCVNMWEWVDLSLY